MIGRKGGKKCQKEKDTHQNKSSPNCVKPIVAQRWLNRATETSVSQTCLELWLHAWPHTQRCPFPHSQWDWWIHSGVFVRQGGSKVDPYSYHRSSHLPLDLNNRRSSIQWISLPHSPRCLSSLIIPKNLRDIDLAGLVERVGVEPTRCYHRGILSPLMWCPLFLCGSTVSMQSQILCQLCLLCL